MKKLIFVLFLFLSAYQVKAQPPGLADTLAYLRQIEAQKSYFIGKPFSVLLDSLKIGIQYFAPYSALHYAKSKETSTAFYFINPETIDDFGYRYIEVYWQTPLNADVSSQIFDDYDGWNAEAAQFYSTGIIEDITVATAPLKIYAEPCEGENNNAIIAGGGEYMIPLLAFY